MYNKDGGYMNIKLPDEVIFALELIEKHGFEAYLVGGCVRDFVMGKIPHDFDIATSCLPSNIRDIFKDFSNFDQGIKHGTVGVIINNRLIEITTYRIDGEYLDARHPSSVSFTTSLLEDLKRRDFTMNALALNKNLEIVDYFNGIEDIKNKRIRAVGNPYMRFNEDALRVLRALRFASTLDFKIEEETSKAIFECYHLLEKISVERIYIELKKLIVGLNVGLILKKFQSVFELIFNISFVNYDLILNSIDELEKDIVTRLAYLLSSKFVRKDAKSILRNLKVDHFTINQITSLLENIDIEISNKVSIKKVLKHLDEDIFLKLIDIKKVIDKDLYQNELILFNQIIKNKECYKLKHLAINGYDLNDLGIEGKRVGEILDLLLNLVIEEKLDNNKKILLDYVNKIK